MAIIKCARPDTNFADISVHVDEHAYVERCFPAIDNMVKGAAGQAIQNMNFGIRVWIKTGLTMIPPAF